MKRQKSIRKKEDYYSVIADLINRLVQQDEINEECLEINFFFVFRTIKDGKFLWNL